MGWLLGPELSGLILPWRGYYGCGAGFRISTMTVGKRHGKNFFRGQSQYWMGQTIQYWVIRFLMSGRLGTDTVQGNPTV